MDIFDFEELTAEILNVTDEQREDDDFLRDRFYDEFEIDFELAYSFARKLLWHTPVVKAGVSGEKYHAFVSRTAPIMHMQIKAKGQGQ